MSEKKVLGLLVVVHDDGWDCGGEGGGIKDDDEEEDGEIAMMDALAAKVEAS